MVPIYRSTHGVTSLRTVNLIFCTAIPLNAIIKHIYVTALYQGNYECDTV